MTYNQPNTPCMIAHKMDLFLDQDATTAMAVPKPMPELVAMVCDVVSAVWAMSGWHNTSNALKSIIVFMVSWGLVAINLQQNKIARIGCSWFKLLFYSFEKGIICSRFISAEKWKLLKGCRMWRGSRLTPKRKSASGRQERSAADGRSP